MSNRKLGLRVLVLACVFLLTTLSAFSQQEEFTLRVGVVPLVEQLPLVIAQKELSGSSSKIKVKLDIYTSWTALEAAFRVGAVDAAAITLPKALIMAYEGVPLKIILLVNRNGLALVLNSDSANDLKGKITGGSGSDTMGLVIFARFLKEKKLKLGYDVRSLLIPFGRANSLLKEDRIYGFCLAEPYGALAEKEKVAKKIIFSKDIYPNHLDSVLIVNPDVLKNHPQVIKEYIKTIIKAAKFIEKDKDDSKGRQTAMAQLDIFKLDPEIVSRSLTMPKDRVVFKDFTPSIKEIEEVMYATMELGALGGVVKLKEIVDTQYIN